MDLTIVLNITGVLFFSTPAPQQAPKLPSASAALGNAAAKKTGDVFSNPFLEAELHKKASLEHHVKMVNNDLQLKNGRKICWNYRKGRCRFGTSCQYAHDSDLSVETSAESEATKVTEIAAPKYTPHSSDKSNNKRKRPGLSDTIEPGKRVMKSYQQQQHRRN